MSEELVLTEEQIKNFKVRSLDQYTTKEKEEHFDRMYRLAADMFKLVSEGVIFNHKDTSIILECVIECLGPEANWHLDYVTSEILKKECGDSCDKDCGCACNCGGFDDEQN